MFLMFFETETIEKEQSTTKNILNVCNGLT